MCIGSLSFKYYKWFKGSGMPYIFQGNPKVNISSFTDICIEFKVYFISNTL